MMDFNQNRLRFVHCEHLFNNSQEIKDYVQKHISERPSLYSEPMIFKYGVEEDPNIVLAIGSVGNGNFMFVDGKVLNKVFYIDFSQAERDIKELYKEVGENREEIERINNIVKNIINASGFDENGNYIPDSKDLITKNAKSLKEADKLLSDYVIALEKRQELYVKETSTINPTLEKGETGTTISGDVKLGSKIVDNRIINNIILRQEDGLFTNVDLDYDKDDSKLIFTVNGDEKKEISIPKEYHVINGEYDVKSESLKLKLNDKIEIDGELTDSISIDLHMLIDEWTVLGNDSKTPIILTKEHIKPEQVDIHDGKYDWQDILSADVRIADKATKPDNILEKTSDGLSLYVDGKASNISYMDGNERITVQEGIDSKITKTSISQNPENTIVYRTDGLYSMIDFSYNEGTNEITFRRTNPKGEVVEKVSKLNSISFLEEVTYDSVNEEIVIVYKDANGEMKTLRIPIQIVVDAFNVDNSNSTVTLTLDNITPGVNTLKADVNISKQDRNILEDVGHALYVRGTADNIEMIDKSLGETVENSISNINKDLALKVSKEQERAEKEERRIEGKLDNEISRAEKAEKDLQSNIDESSRDDKDERDRIERALNDEIDRSKKEDINLKNEITSEIKRASESEQSISNLLNEEITRSKNEDSKLDGDIKKEILDAREAERVLRDSITDESDRANRAEKEIDRKLGEEIKRSVNNDKELTTNLGIEANRASNEEKRIEEKLDNEIVRAGKAEQDIKDIVSKNNAHVDLLEKDLQEKITAEETRAKAAELENKNAIEAEVLNARDEEGKLKKDLDNEISRAKEVENNNKELIEKESNRSIARDEKLSNDLDKAKKDLSFIVKNTGTVNLTKVEQEFGSSISAEVNVSGKEGNLINKDGEPLFAQVDLIYEGDNNKLILKRSGNVDKEIQLNEGSIIESIIYDHERKVLIITYYDSLGNEKHEEVDVTDLFNEWVVETNHLGAVLLTKDINYNGKGTDKLTAEVVVSKLPTNALVNDEGTLYVSNQAKDIMVGDSSLSDKINKLDKTDSDIRKELQDEVVRATSAETSNRTYIEEESTRAKRTEEQLRLDLDNEKSRSETRDNEIQSELNGEIDRSKEADIQLGKDISEERNRASQAENDLSERLSDEVVNRTNDIDKLTTKLDSEITRSVDFDNKLRGDLDSETKRSQDVDAKFQLDLNDEISRATLKETQLQENIETEADRAIAREDAIEIALNDEIKRSSNIDNDLSNKLETEIRRSTDTDNAYKDSLQSEITRASEAETELGTRIDNEITRASQIESQLRKELDNEVTNSEMRYNEVVSNLRTEIDRSKVEDKEIRELLTAETTRATASEIDLSERLSDETTNRVNSDNEILIKLDNEITRSIEFDNKLRGDLDGEIARSKDYDKNSGIKLSNEINERKSEITRIEGLLSSESERSIRVDGELTNSINNEIGRAKSEEKRIEEKFDNKVTNLENADKVLTDNLDKAKKDLSFITKDTGTVTILKEQGETGSVVSATVNVSATKDNLINKNGEALFASVDVAYDSKSNKLILSRSGLDNKEIQLNEGSIIDTITYDEESKELVITYRNSQGESREVRVGVSELFNEWGVETNHMGAVQLTKTRNIDGTDTLKAEVVISEMPDNALINDKGSLYVSNKAKDIILDNGKKIQDEINSLHEADRTLQGNIDAEKIRAEKVETEISGELVKEINRATLKENFIEENLKNEIKRAEKAENENKALIDKETAKRESEIVRVEGLINTEKERAEGSENGIKELLQNEIDRAKSAEEANTKAITNEVTRASNSEEKLNNNIEIISGNVITNKTDIDNKLAAETRRAKEAEEANKKSIEDEIVIARKAEKTNSDNILSEKTRATERENTIEGNLNGEINRASAAEKRLNDLLDAEILRSTNKDNDLNTLITSEIDRSTKKDDELEDMIDNAFNNSSFRTESTPSLELTKISGETIGYVVKGKVRVSPKDENIINNDGESLYASVNVDYDASKNQLTLRRSGNPDKLLQFNQGTLVDTFEFDEKTSNLKIGYKDANGLPHTNSTDLSKLNTNFDVLNEEGSAVILTKTRNQETSESTISAKVIISEDPNNLLKNDKGVLSVTNSADKIVLNDGITVSQSIEALKESDSNLQGNITTEIADRQTADSELRESINNEVSRAKGREGELNTNISNNTTNLNSEIDRALAAEDKLRTDLQNETTRANEADQVLLDKITNEITRAVSAETAVQSNVNAEEVRATTKESDLEKLISNIKSKAESNETKISGISTEVDRISRDYSMSVDDTETIDLTKKILETGGFQITGKAKLSNIDGNTIIKQADGLYSNVDLTYDESNNTLHFKRNDKVADIVLNTVSTIKSITYDSLKDEIVITYIGKNGDELTTRFPAKSLFKPIKANNEGKNVILEVKQVDGTDNISGNVNFVNCIDNQGKNVKLSVTPDNKLSAEAVISTLDNNGLTKDRESGALYVSNQAKDIKVADTTKGENVEVALGNMSDKISDLDKKFDDYNNEDIINQLIKDTNNLKMKTSIVTIDTPSVDMRYTFSETSSNITSHIILSNDPHNLLKVYDDGDGHIADDHGHYPEDTYNGVKFDGNLDYLTFGSKDELVSDVSDKWANWTRHLQMKRNNGLFSSRAEALEFIHNPEFLSDKKDGEPLIARYKNGSDISFVLGFVRISNQGEVQVQTIDNKGTTLDKVEYVPNAKDITTTDDFGIKSVTHVQPESLYIEFTDSSSLKHSIVVPLKELIEEYEYPNSVSTFNKASEKSDGESVKIYHNVKFDVERHEDNKSIIKADIDYYDCGEYDGEDFIK